jgi:hypothetical protein
MVGNMGIHFWLPLENFGKKEWYGNRNISYIAGAMCLGFFNEIFNVAVKFWIL